MTSLVGAETLVENTQKCAGNMSFRVERISFDQL